MMEDIEKIEQEMREVAEIGVSCFLILIGGVVLIIGLIIWGVGG
jgi:hypothetical protein